MNIKERFENFLDEQKIRKEMEIIKAKKAEETRAREEKNKTQYSENLPVERKKFKFSIEQLKEVGLITTAVVLIGVGYVNFSKKEEDSGKSIETASTQYSNNIGDVQLVNSDGSLVENDESNDKGKESKINNQNKSDTESTAVIDDKSSEKETIENNDSKSNEIVNTNSSSSYFTELKMKRDNIYSQKLEVYSQMINSSTISAEQKAIAIQEVSTLTENQNAILVAEELIKLKGFENVVIYVNGDSVSVVVRSAALSLEQVAQIQNIVSRELKTDVSKISISNK